MIQVEYTKNKLDVFGKVVDFKYDIAEVEQNEQYIFVRLAIPSNIKMGESELRNVYAVNEVGKIQWQIKNFPPKNNPEYQCAPIVGIHIDSNGTLFVTDFMGRRFEVEQKSGLMKKLTIVK
ncbi:hypothetical protein [Halalkalibacter sp. APA_J-10(15)]|uniref:hypothetical protein n=1 Tax=Halalkalibacter sp. APA_J-10(15) TaxID=2933805 RepID=UPI001FF5A08D|nr:hypothetical protein [Halalkalibacter sp. APA_J-10(15)]MCK0473844.1 hypothetical protein [Halalkalibacter sp. APA_J-10(15)]